MRGNLCILIAILAAHCGGIAAASDEPAGSPQTSYVNKPISAAPSAGFSAALSPGDQMALRTGPAPEFSSSVFMVIPQVILTLVLLGLTAGMVLSVRRDRDRDFGG